MAQKSNAAPAAKDFDFETVAVVVCCMLENGITLGMKQYQLMATLSGNRTASSFDHQFRKVKARARELQQGLKATPTTSTDDAPTTPQTNEKSTPGKSSGKRGISSSITCLTMKETNGKPKIRMSGPSWKSV